MFQLNLLFMVLLFFDFGIVKFGLVLQRIASRESKNCLTTLIWEVGGGEKFLLTVSARGKGEGGWNTFLWKYFFWGFLWDLVGRVRAGYCWSDLQPLLLLFVSIESSGEDNVYLFCNKNVWRLVRFWWLCKTNLIEILTFVNKRGHKARYLIRKCQEHITSYFIYFFNQNFIYEIKILSEYCINFWR